MSDAKQTATAAASDHASEPRSVAALLSAERRAEIAARMDAALKHVLDVRVAIHGTREAAEASQTFIAHAPRDMSDLLAALEQAERERDAAVARLQWLINEGHVPELRLWDDGVWTFYADDIGAGYNINGQGKDAIAAIDAARAAAAGRDDA